MSRNFIVILTLVVVGMVGLFTFTGSSDDEEVVASIANPREVQENDHKKGSDGAKATLIEYGDFGCPGCGALHPLLLQLEEELGEDFQFVFRHFPLISLHPNAMAAHRAAVAAGEQDKFWEMHDILYERQFEWTGRVASQAQAISIIEGYATELELDIDQFNSDLASSKTFDFIDAQQKSGSELGLTGTPSLLLNGEDFATPRSYEELKAAVEAVIAGDSASESNETEDADTDAAPEATAPEEETETDEDSAQ